MHLRLEDEIRDHLAVLPVGSILVDTCEVMSKDLFLCLSPLLIAVPSSLHECIEFKFKFQSEGLSRICLFMPSSCYASRVDWPTLQTEWKGSGYFTYMEGE